MSGPTVIAPGRGEVVGDSPERRVEILSDHDPLHATWSRFGPGREGADLHVHRRHTDLFYVLEGELTVMLGVEGKTQRVKAGTLARAGRSFRAVHVPDAGIPTRDCRCHKISCR